MSEVSLLWPASEPDAHWPVSADAARDLELDALLHALSGQRAYRETLRPLLLMLCLEPQTIRYRQAVLRELQAQPALAVALRETLPLLDELTGVTFHVPGQSDPLQEVTARARELELLLAIVERLSAGFAALPAPPQAAGLRVLGERLAELNDDEQFRSLAAELPGLLAALRSHASITIGVNLDERLRPKAAVLLAVNEAPFTRSTLLERLLGLSGGEAAGIAPLHQPPAGEPGGLGQIKPLMVPLFRDLAQVLEKVAAPVAQALRRYARFNGRFLAALRPDFVFYTGALALIDRFQAAGLPLTFPSILPAAKRITDAQEAYNPQLAIQALQGGDEARARAIVANDISLAAHGRIAILTGPNQGGKTTYMQAIGLLHVWAQLGLPVPAAAATLSPVDAIYTHYPVEEQLALGTGRLGDEAQRIRTIFEAAGPRSLVLLNESLATTSAGEGLHLARDIVGALRRIGLRAIFTTHMHELAAAAPAINDAVSGTSAVFSLVASRPQEPEGGQRQPSYRIAPGPPLGHSYAQQIAERYGISAEQLLRLLTERGLPDS